MDPGVGKHQTADATQPLTGVGADGARTHGSAAGAAQPWARGRNHSVVGTGHQPPATNHRGLRRQPGGYVGGEKRLQMGGDAERRL